MNLYKQFVKETGLKKEYIKWLEESNAEYRKIPKSDALYDEPKTSMPMKDYSFIDDNGITIDYSNPNLGYEVAVVFPRMLQTDECDQVNNIIDYWSALPFVSVEGNYGVTWIQTKKKSIAMINIDFTKSASDDYGAREILEQLGEFIWKGTPMRKRTKDRKWEGVIRPISVKSGSM